MRSVILILFFVRYDESTVACCCGGAGGFRDASPTQLVADRAPDAPESDRSALPSLSLPASAAPAAEKHWPFGVDEEAGASRHASVHDYSKGGSLPRNTNHEDQNCWGHANKYSALWRLLCGCCSVLRLSLIHISEPTRLLSIGDCGFWG